jgi:spore germination protein YaaH
LGLLGIAPNRLWGERPSPTRPDMAESAQATGKSPIPSAAAGAQRVSDSGSAATQVSGGDAPEPGAAGKLIPSAAHSTGTAAAAYDAPTPVEALFYLIPGDRGYTSFREHVAHVAVIAPQSFALDRFGILHGHLPPEVIETARRSGVAITPVVINAGFSRRQAEELIHNDEAVDNAIGNLVEAADEQGLAGWQLDFEGLHAESRAAFSAFVADAARALHHRGKTLSVAVAARTDDRFTDTFERFSGVYDYGALADAADFISVMAYPEHDASDPGPLASYPWVQQVIEHVLESAPAAKVSLGLPDYQVDFGERRYRLTFYRRIRHRLHRFFHYIWRMVMRDGPANPARSRLHWDPVLKSSYRVTGHGRRRHIIWVEDERAFEAKLTLVSEYKLRGFSVWRIGLEDPRIWRTLPDVVHEADQQTDAAGQPTITERR